MLFCSSRDSTKARHATSECTTEAPNSPNPVASSQKQYSAALESMLRHPESRTRLISLAPNPNMLRFLAAIVEWEGTTQAAERKAKALKLISLYVEPGGMYANAVPVSEHVRDELLARKQVGNTKCFQAAKAELVQWAYSQSNVPI